MKLIDHWNRIDENTSHRKRTELTVCFHVLTSEEFENTSSLRVGYQIARDRLVEEYIKDTEPWLYEKIKKSTGKVPIFEIEDMAREFSGKTD